MLNFSSRHRYYLYAGRTDMRKSFNGLSGLVRAHMETDLMSGDIFLFINKRKDRLKMLVWEPTGFAIYYKRLERGTFEIPENVSGKSSIQLSWSSLIMLLEGIELKSIKKRKRYQKTG